MSKRRARKKALHGAEVDIVDLTHDGRGVARVDGKAVFVHGALPGERVRITHPSVRKDHDEVDTSEVLSPSPHRVEPRCRWFGRCGGCSLQHMDADAQIEAKQAQLLSALSRIGQVEPDEVYPPLVGPRWKYRRRARLSVRYVHGKGRVLVGFRERRAPYVADMDSCEVLDGGVGQLLGPLSAMIGDLSIRERLPQIEVSVGEDRTIMVLRVMDPPTQDDLSRMRRFQTEHDVHFHLQTGGYDTVAPMDDDGPEDLGFSFPALDLELRFLPTDFVQVNAGLNRTMVARAIELMQPAPGHRILDLFAGLGNFSLPLARSGAQVVMVEGAEALVERGRANAERNGLEVEAHVANLFADWETLAWAREPYDGLLLDPPRAGAREVVERLDRIAPGRIVYVSCHPGTLARDAGILVRDQGYRLRGAGVMDMFPHTGHVESIALFERD